MRRIKHILEFSLVKLFDLFFQLLPFGLVWRLGEGLGSLMSKIMPRRNTLILENLAHAFPEKSEEERHRITQGVWKNLGRTAAEFIRLPDITNDPENFPITWEGVEHMDNAMRDQTGVILLGIHFSNWEVLGALIKQRFPRFTAIARPMKNPLVDRWVLSKRGMSGMDIILHRQAVRASLRWVKEKNIIGILVDQNLYTGGEFVDFFGRPAATTTLPALLHARTGAPVILTYSFREGAGFRAVFSPPIVAPSGPEGVEAIKAHTQAISDAIERVVRQTPDNWFWIHNRWKRKQ